VTLEDFIEGDFEKYINNTGEICRDDTSEISLQAEAFVHFTYVNSNQQLIVSDIQGVNYWLCDPEITSAKLMDDKDSSIFFCCGNLSSTAIDNFFRDTTVTNLSPVKPSTSIVKKKTEIKNFNTALNIIQNFNIS